MLRLMRLIDEQFLETPWEYGSRQMTRHLRRSGWCVGRHRVRRLMLKMGLAPIYQRPKTSEPHPQHRIWPYLLRHLTIDRPNQGLVRRRDLHPDAQRLPVPGRNHGLVRAARFWRGGYRTRWMLTAVSQRWSRRSPASANLSDLQYRSRLAVHQLCLHQHPEGCRHPHLDGRSWPLDGQRLHRAAVALAEIRMRLPQCLRDRQ